MKKLIFTLAIVFVGFISIKAQQITFESETIDYGNIKKGADGMTQFKFTNTGDAPLILKKVDPSCGCTLVDYTKNPIAPKDSGVIKVGYKNTHIPGAFSKSISVFTNDKESPRKVLRIKGTVLE